MFTSLATRVLVLCALLALASATEEKSIINRRVLESEPGWTTIVKHLNDYELHDFAKHEPTRRALSTAGEKGMTYELNVLGRRVLLDLERYDELFAKDYKHYLLDENGNIVKTEPALDCIYKGKSRDNGRTLATVTLCEGMVHATVHEEDPNESFSIQPLELKTGSEHVVYRHRDLRDPERYCGVGRNPTDGVLPKQPTPLMDVDGRRLRVEEVHDHHHDHIHAHDHLHEMMYPKGRGDRKLDSTTKVIGVSVANDKKRFDQKGSAVHLHSSSLLATANNLYTTIGPAPFSSTLQYRLEIVSMFTFTMGDPWTHTAGSASNTNVPIDANGEVSAQDQLTAYDFWRKANVQSPPQHDVGHLLTGFTFQSTTIGLAFVSAVCTNSRSGTTQAFDLPDAHISSTITHEIGHNLGSQHTDTPPPGFPSCLDANGGLIMAASSAVANTNWDKCTIEYFRLLFTGSQYASNKCAETTADPGGNPVWTGDPVCGDGLIQGSEECDCINNNCLGIDPCCNGATCKLLPGKQCSAQGSCCDGSCQIITDTSHVCRAAVSQCDIPETCPGDSGFCPFDKFNDTGTDCILPEFGNIHGTCFFKQCMDQTKDCFNEGKDRTNPAEHWNLTCRSDTLGAVPSSNDCVLSCKLTVSGTCESLVGPVFYSDGTQCRSGHGCFQGNCIAFDQIPVPNNPNCTNGVVDQNETDLDCGGPNCFGCGANKLCSADKDCVFPGFCNKTGTLTDANGYTALGRCSATGKPSNPLEDFLNAVLKWFNDNPFIWGPIVGVIGLLLLFCCFCPRGNHPPVAKAGMLKASESFRHMRGGQTEIPTAMVVKGT